MVDGPDRQQRARSLPNRGRADSASPARVDPNRIVADAASNCALQAVHKGLKLTVNYGEVPRGNFDPRHLERSAPQPARLLDRAG